MKISCFGLAAVVMHDFLKAIIISAIQHGSFSSSISEITDDALFGCQVQLQ